jgi:FAD/FMN-containing dehydrogenase
VTCVKLRRAEYERGFAPPDPILSLRKSSVVKPAASRKTVTNFGGNLKFCPGDFYLPENEADVLAILNRHAKGKIRVVGSRHSWSEAIVTEEALVDMSHFQQVEIERGADGETWANVGGGCPLKHILEELARKANVTLPAIGLITEQTIAGAISTATHGSGRPSLSHYMAEIRVAAYDAATGQGRVFVWNDGPHLRAARCALGCMGIILSVKFRCIRQYSIAETVRRYATIDDVLAQEGENPLQQFFLIPHAWAFYAQQRRVLPADHSGRSWYATLYRIYWFCFIDVGLHSSIKLCAAWLRSRRLVHLFYRWVLPWLIWQPRNLVERSDVALIMEHELFRHLEFEIFVPARHVRQAAHFVRQVLTVFDGADNIDPFTADELEKRGLLSRLMAQRGNFTFHYPITFRRVLPDDTLISMTAEASEPYYAISFITYVEPRDAFFQLAQFLAESMVALFSARLHWGKYFPLQYSAIEEAYPNLAEFRATCRQTDPQGVFCNDYVNRVLGFRE